MIFCPTHLPEYDIYDIFHNDVNSIVIICRGNKNFFIDLIKITKNIFLRNIHALTVIRQYMCVKIKISRKLLTFISMIF